jgi:transmembrane sensor
VNTSGSHQHAERAAEEAAAWHVRLAAESAAEADFLAFEAWVSDPVHRTAYDAIDALDEVLAEDAAGLLKALDAPAAEVLPFKPVNKQPVVSGGVSRRMMIGGAMAAGLVAVVAGPILLKPSLQWTTYTTAPGETRRLDLEDGSTVTMNGASTLKVAFSSKERRVEMADAEATFEVAKNPARPFLIGARGNEIKVVGTEFNIFNFDGATRVTVRRGIVQVHRSDGGKTARLLAGQEFAQSGAAPGVIRACDPADAFAWRSGQLVYDDARLTDVVSALNRRFRTPMRLEGGAGDTRFTGVLSLDSEEAVVRRLEAFLPISAERVGGEYVLRQRAP